MLCVKYCVKMTYMSPFAKVQKRVRGLLQETHPILSQALFRGPLRGGTVNPLAVPPVFLNWSPFPEGVCEL